MKLQVTASSSPRAAAVRRTSPLDQLRAGGGRLRDARRAIERGRRHLVVADDPRDLLDQVGGSFDVTPPRRDGDIGAVHLEPEALEDLALALLGHVDAAERFGAAEIED